MRPAPIRIATAASVLIAAAAAAQQRPIFDLDDSLNPHSHKGAVFISRIVFGGALNATDDYRPLHQSTGFVQLVNSVYWSRIQFDYKHSEVRGKESGPAKVQACGCSPPVYFPTPPSDDATPAPPLPGSRDTLQFAWYRSAAAGFSEPANVYRYRLTVSRQQLDTIVSAYPSGEITARLSGREQSIGVEADTRLRLGGRDFRGSLQFARTVRSGTADDRAQSELAYTSRFPVRAIGPVLVRAMLTIGGVANRGATGINVVNPAFEAFWHHFPSQTNVRLIWSPQSTRSGARGWETHHQIALIADHKLYVKVFRARK